MKNRKKLSAILISLGIFLVSLPAIYFISYEWVMMHGLPTNPDAIYKNVGFKIPAGAKMVYGRYYPVRDRYFVAVVDLSSADIDSMLSASPKSIKWNRYDKHVPVNDPYNGNDDACYDYDSCRLDAKTWFNNEFVAFVPSSKPVVGKRFIYGESHIDKSDIRFNETKILITFDEHGKRTMYLFWKDVIM